MWLLWIWGCDLWPCLFPVAKVSYNEEEETATLQFEAALTPGNAVISMEYVGTLNDKMKGFYRSKYHLPSAPDKELYAAVTQFEVCNNTAICITVEYE